MRIPFKGDTVGVLFVSIVAAGVLFAAGKGLVEWIGGLFR